MNIWKPDFEISNFYGLNDFQLTFNFGDDSWKTSGVSSLLNDGDSSGLSFVLFSLEKKLNPPKALEIAWKRDKKVIIEQFESLAESLVIKGGMCLSQGIKLSSDLSYLPANFDHLLTEGRIRPI